MPYTGPHALFRHTACLACFPGENKEKLASAGGFDEVFELVKKAVDQVLGAHRAGLTLVPGRHPEPGRGPTMRWARTRS